MPVNYDHEQFFTDAKDLSEEFVRLIARAREQRQRIIDCQWETLFNSAVLLPDENQWETTGFTGASARDYRNALANFILFWDAGPVANGEKIVRIANSVVSPTP